MRIQFESFFFSKLYFDIYIYNNNNNIHTVNTYIIYLYSISSLLCYILYLYKIRQAIRKEYIYLTNNGVCITNNIYIHQYTGTQHKNIIQQSIKMTMYLHQKGI